MKIPHSGRLEVENDVEVGANSTIDRATFETTRIGEGTKIDNLVMIGHNNQIGRHNLLVRPGRHLGELQDRRLRGHGRPGGHQGQDADRPPRDRRRPGGRAPQYLRRSERAGLAGDPRPRTAAGFFR